MSPNHRVALQAALMELVASFDNRLLYWSLTLQAFIFPNYAGLQECGRHAISLIKVNSLFLYCSQVVQQFPSGRSSDDISEIRAAIDLFG